MLTCREMKDVRRDAIAIALLIGIVIAAHAAILRQWWLWDDPQLLYGALELPAAGFLFTPEVMQRESSSFFTPMLMLSYEAGVVLFGIEPRGFYAIHLLVFALAIIAVYAFTRTYTDPATSFLAAAAVALAQPSFTVVTLLMDRHYIEGLLFALLALIAFRRNRPVLGTLCYLIGCLEKEVIVPLPLLVLVQDYVTGRDRRTMLRNVLSCAGITVIYLVWRIWMLGSFGGYGGAMHSGSLVSLLSTGWLRIAGAIGLVVLLLALVFLTTALRRAPMQTIAVVAATAIFVIVPIAGLTTLDSRYFFIAAVSFVLLAAFTVRGRVERVVFAMLCVAIALGGIAHGIRLRRDFQLMQRDGLHLWNAPSNAPPLFTGANGWYIEGVRWLRARVKGDRAPEAIASLPGLVIRNVRPRTPNAEYEAVRKSADPQMPLTVEMTRRGSVFSWSLGPRADAFFFVTPVQELVWTREAKGWIRLPADVYLPTSYSERDRRVRVMRRAGDRWTVSAELPFPRDGQTVRWSRD